MNEEQRKRFADTLNASDYARPLFLLAVDLKAEGLTS